MTNLTPEKPELNFGFMPLSDCAPLVVAKEMGFFAAQGLSVNLLRQNSWATLRDKLHAGLLDAAQMLAPMPLASHLGYGVSAMPMSVPFVLSYNGNGITLSNALFSELLACHKIEANMVLREAMRATYLKPLVVRRREAGKAKLRFATVFPYSCHFYQLVSWLNGGDIALDDIDMTIIPPSGMVAALDEGLIDGFCVGSPWNGAAVRLGIGTTVVTSNEIWPDAPEKVLGVTTAWREQHPHTLACLIRALHQACRWLADTPHRFEAARMLSEERYLNAELDVVAPALLESCLTKSGFDPRSMPGYNRFFLANAGNTPPPVFALKLLQDMQQCHHIGAAHDLNACAHAVFQPQQGRFS